MTDDEFDIKELATYLQIPPQQVERLAARGQLPARRIGGDWRFSRAELHHWMEDRMGSLDSQELAKVEARLHHGPRTIDVIPITQLLPVSAVEIPLIARTRGSVISRMAHLAEQTGLLWDASRMAEAVAAREDMQPTALENGAALLHPRRPQTSILGDNIVSLGISAGGVPFGTRRLTDVFFLVCSVDDRTHLRLLARLSRLLSMDGFLDALRGSSHPSDVIACIREFEESLANITEVR